MTPRKFSPLAPNIYTVESIYNLIYYYMFILPFIRLHHSQNQVGDSWQRDVALSQLCHMKCLVVAASDSNCCVFSVISGKAASQCKLFTVPLIVSVKWLQGLVLMITQARGKRSLLAHPSLVDSLLYHSGKASSRQLRTPVDPDAFGHWWCTQLTFGLLSALKQHLLHVFTSQRQSNEDVSSASQLQEPVPGCSCCHQGWNHSLSSDS